MTDAKQEQHLEPNSCISKDIKRIQGIYHSSFMVDTSHVDP